MNSLSNNTYYELREKTTDFHETSNLSDLPRFSFPSSFTTEKRKKFHINENIPISIQSVYFHVEKPDRRGHNCLYESKRSKSFLFELNDFDHNTNQIQLYIHTNDKTASSFLSRYTSNRRFPNEKYRLAVMITHFFKSQKVLPRRIQNKYFNLIHKKLLERITIISNRKTSTSPNNRPSRTFFRFSYKRFRFRFGIYVPSCTSRDIPASVIYSDNFNAPIYPQEPTDNKCPSELVRNSLYNRWFNKSSKTIVNNKYGFRYKQQILTTPYKAEHRFAAPDSIYCKAHKDFEISNKDHLNNIYKAKTLTKQRDRRNNAFNRLINRFVTFPSRVRPLTDRITKYILNKARYLSYDTPFAIKPLYQVTFDDIRDDHFTSPYPMANIPHKSHIPYVKRSNISTSSIKCSLFGDLPFNFVPIETLPKNDTREEAPSQITSLISLLSPQKKSNGHYTPTSPPPILSLMMDQSPIRLSKRRSPYPNCQLTWKPSRAIVDLKFSLPTVYRKHINGRDHSFRLTLQSEKILIKRGDPDYDDELLHRNKVNRKKTTIESYTVDFKDEYDRNSDKFLSYHVAGSTGAYTYTKYPTDKQQRKVLNALTLYCNSFHKQSIQRRWHREDLSDALGRSHYFTPAVLPESRKRKSYVLENKIRFKKHKSCRLILAGHVNLRKRSSDLVTCIPPKRNCNNTTYKPTDERLIDIGAIHRPVTLL